MITEQREKDSASKDKSEPSQVDRRDVGAAAGAGGDVPREQRLPALLPHLVPLPPHLPGEGASDWSDCR